MAKCGGEMVVGHRHPCGHLPLFPWRNTAGEGGGSGGDGVGGQAAEFTPPQGEAVLDGGAQQQKGEEVRWCMVGPPDPQLFQAGEGQGCPLPDPMLAVVFDPPHYA